MNFPRIFLRRVIKRNNLFVGKRRRKIVKSESGFKKLRTKLRNVCTRKNWSSVDNPADTSVIGNLISRFVSSRGKPHDGTHMRYPLKGDSKTIHPLIDDYLPLFLRYFFFFFSFLSVEMLPETVETFRIHVIKPNRERFGKCQMK